MFSNFDPHALASSPERLKILLRLEKLLRGGCSFRILRTGFRLGFHSLERVELDHEDDLILLTARARLKAPFEGPSREIKLAYLLGSGAFHLSFTAPTSVVDLVREQVLPVLEGHERAMVKTQLLPCLAAMKQPEVVVGRGEDGGGYDGVAFTANLKAHQMEPFRSLSKAFENISLTGSTQFRLGFRQGRSFHFELTASPAVDSHPGSWFTLKQVDLNWDHRMAGAHAGVQTLFQVDLGEEILHFQGGLEVEPQVAITGALATENGWWEQPFGVEGLRVKNLRGRITPLRKVPHAGLHLEGRAYVGNLDLEGELSLLVNPGDLREKVLILATTREYSLGQVIRAFTGGTPSAGLARLKLNNTALEISPNGAQLHDHHYAEGVTLKTQLTYKGYGGALEGRIRQDAGGALLGYLNPISMPAKQPVLRLEGVQDQTAPGLEIQLGETQSMHLQGRLRFLDAVSNVFTAELTTQGFKAVLEGEAMGLFAQKTVTWLDGVFTMKCDHGFDIHLKFKQKLTLAAGATITVVADDQGFTQKVVWWGNMFGRKIKSPEWELKIPCLTATQLEKHLSVCRTALTERMRELACDPDDKAVTWLRNKLDGKMKKVARFLREAGAEGCLIVQVVARVFGKSHEKVARNLTSDRKERKSLLQQLQNG